jgi:hypothetical protein
MSKLRGPPHYAEIRVTMTRIFDLADPTGLDGTER